MYVMFEYPLESTRGLKLVNKSDGVPECTQKWSSTLMSDKYPKFNNLIFMQHLGQRISQYSKYLNRSLGIYPLSSKIVMVSSLIYPKCNKYVESNQRN